jgi:hypothetical protein
MKGVVTQGKMSVTRGRERADDMALTAFISKLKSPQFRRILMVNVLDPLVERDGVQTCAQVASRASTDPMFSAVLSSYVQLRTARY